MLNFQRKSDLGSEYRDAVKSIESGGVMSAEQERRATRIKTFIDFYEGYHWEGIPADKSDRPMLTVNYCRAFVDKFVAFELGDSFTYAMKPSVENLIAIPDDVPENAVTVFKYLEKVWVENNQFLFAVDLGVMKGITGDVWVQISYLPRDKIAEEDIFEEYPNGRIKLSIIPTELVIPEYDQHNRDVLKAVNIMYYYNKRIVTPVLGYEKTKRVLYKMRWTRDKYTIEDGEEKTEEKNPYGIIPFVQIRNLPLPGKSYGRSDLEDIVPMNAEYNMKSSDIAEIIDYHAAPITVVQGAKVGNLEKGANKVWGGLPHNAKVYNLELASDLGASTRFVENLKVSMCEVAGIPKAMLGDNLAISNTSGVALQYANMPLIERTKIKKNLTENGLELINKYILYISLKEELIQKPENVKLADFLFNEVTIPNTLPKDMLMELQQIQMEMALALLDRAGALKRLGRENIEKTLEAVDQERKDHPELFAPEKMLEAQNAKMNSGMGNGQTPKEVKNVAVNGENKG